MATYTIETRAPWRNRKVICKRFDAFQFHAHKAVYEAAGAQGLRDTQAAWSALRRVYDMGKCGLENIKLGDVLIVLNT